jgi:hypothetical protein
MKTTLDLYTQSDGDETRAAQGAFLKELGMDSEMIQRAGFVGRIVGWGFR